MALHPGDVEYSNQEIRPISGDLPFSDIAQLVKDALRPCRCDGGCNDCGACRAERKLKANGIPVDAESLRAIQLKLVNNQPVSLHGTQTGRFDSSKPNQANTPKSKPRWIMHNGNFAHTDTITCNLCGAWRDSDDNTGEGKRH